MIDIVLAVLWISALGCSAVALCLAGIGVVDMIRSGDVWWR
jgi:hypothetical protein